MGVLIPFLERKLVLSSHQHEAGLVWIHVRYKHSTVEKTIELPLFDVVYSYKYTLRYPDT